jgi:hypothetical protein
MNPKQITDVARDLQYMVYPNSDHMNKLTEWIERRADVFEKKIDPGLSEDLTEIMTYTGLLHFIMGYVAGQTFDVTDPELVKKLQAVKGEFCRQEIFSVIPRERKG